MQDRTCTLPFIMRGLVCLFVLFCGVILWGIPSSVDAQDKEKEPSELVPGGFGGRSGALRIQMVQEGGGNAASEATVAAGLKWLALHQAEDGHWSLGKFNEVRQCECKGAGGSNNDVAATAFGLLPFLAAGQTHKEGANKGNLYVKEVDRALKYFDLKQNKYGEIHSNMYAQGLATIALCEAYGMTGHEALKRPAQRAVDYIVEAQSKEGGWRYASCHKGPGGYDTSIGGWQMAALKSGQLAGLKVPDKTFKGASDWLDAAQSENGAAYGYASPQQGTPATSASGLLCRQYLGWSPRQPSLRTGVDNLHKIGPQANNMYYSYYATQIIHHVGGTDWEKWNPKMRDDLIAAQDKGDKTPHQKGSWYDLKDSCSSGQGGRIMQTSLSLLTLEVYYRHAPLYPPGDKKD